MPIVKIFVAGVVFLFLTILVNAGANALKFTSWYTFLGDVNSLGLEKAFTKLSIVSILWLFIGYPLTLGYLVYFLRRMF